MIEGEEGDDECEDAEELNGGHRGEAELEAGDPARLRKRAEHDGRGRADKTAKTPATAAPLTNHPV